GSIRAEKRTQQIRRLCWREHHRSSPLTEKSGRRRIAFIRSPREDIGSNHEYSLAVVVRERTSQNQRIQKSRTRSGKIDRAALRKSETVRHQRRCRREQMIRRA